jgi:predicted RND superfamily exporter protein
MVKLCKYPLLVLLVCALVTLFFAFQLPRLELDNNNFRFISAEDPARIVSEYIDDTFGSSVFILVALRKNYGDVFDADFLKKIADYVKRIEAIEIINPVTSLVTADYISGGDETITVEKLLPGDFTGTREEIARLKDKVLSWDMYKHALVSDDFTATQILVPMDVRTEDAGLSESVDSFIQVRDIAKEMFSGQAEVYVTGIPVISATINEAMRDDLAVLVPLVILVVLVVLFFSFRNFQGVLLPLLTVIISAVWSIGAMPLFSIKLSVVSTVLPVILVAVGSAYGIHVLAHYLEERAARALDFESHRALVIDVTRRVAKPVFLAALTTFAGFLSFCFTTVLPIREFGFFASFGVLASLAIALTVIPSLLIIRGPRPFPLRNKKESGFFSAFVSFCLKKKSVLAICVLVIIVSVIGASKLVIDNEFIAYFGKDTDIYKSDVFVREVFGGSKIISVVAQADSSEELLSPDTLGVIDNLARYMETRVSETGKVMGFTNLVKRMNQVFNAGESPAGIPASASASGSAASDDFGFGFDTPDDEARNGDAPGDFGFSDALDAPMPVFDETPEEFNSRAGNEYLPSETEQAVELISRAARSSDNANPDALELVQSLKKLTNYEGASYYEIPREPSRYGKKTKADLAAIVSNYLVLLSGSIDDYSDDPLEPKAIKTTIQLKTTGDKETRRAIKSINDFLEAHIPPNIRVMTGGSAAIEISLNEQVVRSQLISLAVSLALVLLIIAVSNKSVTAGFIGIVPLSLSILVNFAIMGFLGIRLNIGTSLIASLAVGIGVDYSIHYMEAFKRECRRLGRPPVKGELGSFLKKTFSVSGKAIIINAVSVGSGFAVLILSRFIMLRDFGLLVALTMLISALVSLTVLPALLLTLKPRFMEAK